MTDKQPFVVHCRECSHEWNAAYLPMTLSDFAKVGKGVRCPMCASDKVFCGPATKVEASDDHGDDCSCPDCNPYPGDVL